MELTTHSCYEIRMPLLMHARMRFRIIPKLLLLESMSLQLTYDKEFYDALLARDIDRLVASICTPHTPLEAGSHHHAPGGESRWIWGPP